MPQKPNNPQQNDKSAESRIVAFCNECGVKLKLKSKHAGRRVKCPKCRNPTLIPADAGTTAPQAGGVSVETATDEAMRATQGDATAQKKTKQPRKRKLPAIEGYKITGELGHGGMGVVYRARDLKLKREVALKMVLAGAHAGEKKLRRFRSEAEAVARLGHPNIVQIHEIGESEGLPYFSLEFVDGGSLEQKLAGESFDPAAAAQLVKTVAEGMHYAHRQGIVHRDLKPANVLLTQAGVPKITDFGLAKQLEEEGQTKSMAVMGTPAYMAPEQAGGQAKTAGPAADVYALGAVLYELLAGRSPFVGESPAEILHQVQFEEPVPPGRIASGVPRDLETICLKCLEKEPRDRYASAEEIADDLMRYLRQEPIKARPIGPVGRAVKWVRRRPLVAGLSAAVVVVAGIAVIGISVFSSEAEEASREAKEAGRVAEKAEREKKRQETVARRSNYPKLLLAAADAWRNGNVTLAREQLAGTDPKQRGWEYYYLERQLFGEGMTIADHRNGCADVAFSPDGSLLATCGQQDVRLWDAQTGKQIRTMSGHEKSKQYTDFTGVFDLAFSPDGKRLASAGGDAVRVWDVVTGEQLAVLGDVATERAVPHAVDYSPDGSVIATLDNRWAGRANKPYAPAARLWDAESYEERNASDDQTKARQFARMQQAGGGYHLNSPHSARIAFSPDGRFFVQGTTVYDVESGNLAGAVPVQQRVTSMPVVTVSPTQPENELPGADAALPTRQQFLPAMPSRGRGTQATKPTYVRLAWSKDDDLEVNDFRTFSVPTPPGNTRKGGRRGIPGIPSRRGAAQAGLMPTGSPVRLRGHSNTISALAFHPGADILASGSWDKTVRLWNVTTGTEIKVLRGHTDFVTGLAFSPDGNRLAAAGGGRVIVWDIDQYAKPAPLTPLAGEKSKSDRLHTSIALKTAVHDVAFLSEETMFVAGNRLSVYDAADGSETKSLTDYGETGRAVAVSPDRKRYFVGERDGSVVVLEASTNRTLQTLDVGAGEISDLELDHSGRMLAVGCRDQTVTLYDARSGERRRRFGSAENRTVTRNGKTYKVAGGAVLVRFLPGSSRLVFVRGMELVMVDAADGAEVFRVENEDARLTGLAVSPNGTRIVTGSAVGIQVRDATGEWLFEYDTSETRKARTVAYSPGGRRVASLATDVGLIVWDAETGQQLMQFHELEVGISPVLRFSPDGRRILAEREVFDAGDGFRAGSER